MLVNFVVMIVIGIWIIVGWHRFILVEETPLSYWPIWRGGLIKRYFARAFFIGLAMLVPLIVVSIGAVMLLGARNMVMGPNGDAPAMWMLYSLIIGASVSYFSLRISFGLPAASVEKLMFIRESWEDTKSYQAEIIGASIVLTLVYIPVNIINFKFVNSLPLILIGQVLGALIMLLSISVLTTLYGVIKEARELS